MLVEFGSININGNEIVIYYNVIEHGCTIFSFERGEDICKIHFPDCMIYKSVGFSDSEQSILLEYIKSIGGFIINHGARCFEFDYLTDDNIFVYAIEKYVEISVVFEKPVENDAIGKYSAKYTLDGVLISEYGFSKGYSLFGFFSNYVLRNKDSIKKLFN